MLRELTLFGEVDKVKIAIERIREFEPHEGYYVAFSGGKDSVVVLDLVRQAGVKYDAHYNITTVDPPELVQFIKKEYPEVERHRPEKTMWQLIVENGMPPTRIVRYCCSHLKERGGIDRMVITGVRWEESSKRRKRRMTELCYNQRKRFLHPIIDWTEQEVWEYIKERNLPYCKLYDEGFERLGCIMCPMKGTKGMERDAKRWPKFYKAYLRAFDRMLQKRKEKCKKGKGNWGKPEDVMNWWIYQPPKCNPDQIVFE